MRGLIFDLDGTLIDSVYAHALAWQKSFAADGMHVPAWSIHNKIGLGGQELALAIGRELGKPVSEDEADRLDKRHGAIMKNYCLSLNLCRAQPRFSAACVKCMCPGASRPPAIGPGSRRRCALWASPMTLPLSAKATWSMPSPNLIRSRFNQPNW
jgi:hypothetical protein